MHTIIFKYLFRLNNGPVATQSTNISFSLKEISKNIRKAIFINIFFTELFILGKVKIILEDKN